MDDRGQTLHDYVAGISVFVLTVAVVLGLLPSVVATFDVDSADVDATQANRIADFAVSNLSVGDGANVLDAENLTSVMAKDEAELRERYGLADFRFVNVTLTNLNGSRILTDSGTPPTPMSAGPDAADEGATSAARIVQVSKSGFDCTPACRLVVRVW